MKVGEAVSKLEKSKVFKDFVKDNPKYYPVHAFKMIVEDASQDWELGYYSEEKDNVIVFEVGGKINMMPEQQVFKKKDSITKIEYSKVKVGWEDALNISEEEKSKNHGPSPITKKIIILQNLDGKQVFNITLITSSFDIVNIRIDSASGKVVSQTKSSILNLGKKLV